MNRSAKAKSLKKGRPRTSKPKTSSPSKKPKNNSNLIRKVPKSLYLKALEEIKKDDTSCPNLRNCCHNMNNRYFNHTEDPNNRGNLVEGMRQALEDRNFKVLYEIINKALEIKSPPLLTQIHEYMFLAINHDPLIKDKEKALHEFCIRVKNLTTDRECNEYLKNMNSLRQSSEADDEYEKLLQNIEDNLDNVSEASIDLKVFEAIKTELDES